MITIEYLWQQISRYLVSKRTILKSSNYSGDADYTKLIIDMIEIIGKEINCHVEKEYWPRVDINYFDRETPNNWEEWAREVAIEHENNAGTWTEELDKLFAINAGIKVLIAYSDKSDAELLKDFNRKDIGSILSIYNSRKYHTENDKYLLIFGPVSASNRKVFSAFIFDGKKVEQIPGCVEI